MKNLKEKENDYFVREDMVSEQHVNHISEYREKKKDRIIFTGAILEDTTPQPKGREAYEMSDFFLG